MVSWANCFHLMLVTKQLAPGSQYRNIALLKVLASSAAKQINSELQLKREGWPGSAWGSQ